LFLSLAVSVLPYTNAMEASSNLRVRLTNPHDRLEQLRRSFGEAWCRETSSAPQAWSAENPALGQCAVTALVIQDELGGELLRAVVGEVSHYWNRIPSGEEVDITRHQFSPVPMELKGEVRDRDYLLTNEDTVRRYRLLRAKLELELRSRVDCA
jgi:hypothetical protein